AEAFPTSLPPLRADAPTLIVGKLKENKAITYTLEGTVAGQDVRLEPTTAITDSEADNFFLVSMVEQWRKAPDQPALFPAARALSSLRRRCRNPPRRLWNGKTCWPSNVPAWPSKISASAATLRTPCVMLVKFCGPTQTRPRICSSGFTLRSAIIPILASAFAN